MQRGPMQQVVNGAAVALVLVVFVAVAGFVYARVTGALDKIATLDRVVVVLATTAEDDAQVGGIVASVTQDGTEVQVLDPLRKVTIAGTSYDRLRDAYPFGGALAVAQALDPGAGARVAWVDVPQDAWVDALGTQGDAVAGNDVNGARVTLPRAIEVFDGQRLASFPEGTSVVPAADVPLLLRGVVYLPVASRTAVMEAVGRSALRALGASGANKGVSTNLTTDALKRLLGRLEAL